MKEFIKKHLKTIIISFIILALMVASVLLFGWIGLWYDAIIAMIVGVCLSDLRKHSFLKILFIIMLLIMLVSNFLPGRYESVSRIGAGDLMTNYLSIVLQNFSYIVIFVLTVGGFYGVLSKTPSYKKLVDNIVSKVKPFSKRFIFVIMIVFAVVASLTGMTMPLFIFIPFVVTIILLLGYDKLVAFSATFGSILIGYIGGVFVNFSNPSTGAINTYETYIGLDSKFANTFPKLLLLFAGLALLIYFVDRHIKAVEAKKVKYDLKDNGDLLIAQVKGKYKDIKTWPLIVTLSLTFVLLVIGMMPWNQLFNVSVFSDFHKWLLGIHIKDFYIFPSIISESLPALGEWSGTGNSLAIYVYISMLLMFVTFIIMLINKMKANDALDNFVEGVKKALPAAALITVAYSVLVCAYNNGFYEVLITSYGKFNFGVSSLLAVVGTILNVDTTWIMIGVYSPIVNLITDESIYPAVAVLLQGIYGIVAFAGPTSLFLITGLTYLDIPYTTWLKYIWRFILYLIILVAIVTLCVVLM